MSGAGAIGNSKAHAAQECSAGTGAGGLIGNHVENPAVSRCRGDAPPAGLQHLPQKSVVAQASREGRTAELAARIDRLVPSLSMKSQNIIQ